MSKDSLKKSEFLTRKRLIDDCLKKAGWKVVRYKDDRSPSEYVAEVAGRYGFCAIEEYPTENGPADYALCVGGRILGIVEAKKLTLGPQNVLMQAERYAKGLTGKPYNFRGYGVPFLYSTNGEVTWHHDTRPELNRSRQIAHFHTPDALAELLQRDLEASCDKLAGIPNDHPLIRPYQKDANEETEKAIANRKRRMLLAMATGTGKTFTLVNQIYRLMEAGVARRILFLVDRQARISSTRTSCRKRI